MTAAAGTSALLELRDERRFPAPRRPRRAPRRPRFPPRPPRRAARRPDRRRLRRVHSPAYAWLHDQLADTVTTVAYDRPRYGWSDPADRPVDPAATADDLHTALAARGLPGPHILVGHSLGAHYARIFAQRHPDDVALLVLLNRRTRTSSTALPTSRSRPSR